MDFILNLSGSPFHPTCVSNPKNTTSPHSSTLNSSPSSLRAGPIPGIYRETCSLLLLGWSSGDLRGTSEHGGPGFGLFWGLNFIHRISITKASSAVSRRDLGACQGQTEEVNSLKRPLFTCRPNRSLSITPSTRPSPHLLLLKHWPESLYYADLMTVEGNPKDLH